LKSWSLIDKEFQDWELHIYGKFDENLGLEQLAKDLKIEKQVFFIFQRKILKKNMQNRVFLS
jgi:hypothetical protein